MKSRDTMENTPSKLTARALGAPLDTTTSRPCALPLLLLWRRGVEFGHFLLNSLAEANPQGCQRVAGGRSGKGGNDHRKAASESEHPGRSARAATWSARAGSQAGLAPPPGCRTSAGPLPGGRRPHKPRRPPATLWQPFGLTKPECLRERAGVRGNRAHAKPTVSGGLGLASLTLVPVAFLALASYSSPPPPPPPAAQAPAASPAATPALIDAGVIMETATGMVTMQSIDAAARTLVLKRADGLTATFKAGPEIRRFNQLKVGDQIMSTVTDNSTIFVLKEKLTPSAAASQAVVRTPEGASVGGIIVNAINIDAKVLDVDLDHRTVLLQYGPTQTRSVSVRPTVDLSQVAVNDTVLVRGTQTISIRVENPWPSPTNTTTDSTDSHR